MSSHPHGLRHYLRSIGKALPYPMPMKQYILGLFREGIEDYLLQNPQAGMEEIQAHFGSPLEIAAHCLDGQDVPFLLSNIKRKQKVLSAVAGVMAAMILTGAVSVAFGTFSAQHDRLHYAVEKIQSQ